MGSKSKYIKMPLHPKCVFGLSSDAKAVWCVFRTQGTYTVTTTVVHAHCRELSQAGFEEPHNGGRKSGGMERKEEKKIGKGWKGLETNTAEINLW